MNKTIINLFVTSACCVTLLPAYAAKPVNLNKQDIRILRAFTPSAGLKGMDGGGDLKEIKHSKDFKDTTHVRYYQTYFDYTVWGGEVILHIPNTSTNTRHYSSLMVRAEQENATMNGVLYQDLKKDLANTPPFVFSEEQAEKAFVAALTNYQASAKRKGEVSEKESNLIVYIDDNSKAHWAYHVTFYLEGRTPAAPNYIVDAITLQPYEVWNDIKHLTTKDDYVGLKPKNKTKDNVKHYTAEELGAVDKIEAGGIGGNKLIGKRFYDGLKGNLPKLDMHRNPTTNTCYLITDQIAILDYKEKKDPNSKKLIELSDVVNFPCEMKDEEHDNIYWAGQFHSVNGGYSPDLDALYAGKVVIDLYKSWYDITVLENDKKPMMLELVMHSPNYDEDGEVDPDNAIWDPRKKRMYFGDGDILHPLVSVGITAHEVSHGFTEQNSDLYYGKQSGAMNEAFSDMAAQAAELFVYGKASWKIGGDVVKKEGEVIRYMDEPTKDCLGTRIPGERCSMAHVKDYNRYVRDHRYDTMFITRFPNVHHSSGIFNRMFYVMSTAPEWGTNDEALRKAFNVMVKANQHYWGKYNDFVKGACGILSAAKDYEYDDAPIKRAISEAGIDITDAC